jgi:hypothetical protein
MSATVIVMGQVTDVYNGEVMLHETPEGPNWSCFGIAESVQIGDQVKVAGLFELDQWIDGDIPMVDLIIRQAALIHKEMIT